MTTGTLARSSLALCGCKPLGKVPQDPHPTFSKRALARATKLLGSGITVGLGKHHPILEEAEDAIA